MFTLTAENEGTLMGERCELGGQGGEGTGRGNCAVALRLGCGERKEGRLERVGRRE